MKRRLFGRKDGYRLRKTDPFFRLIPHIMKERSDAQVFFEDRVYIEQTRSFIRELRKEGYRVGFLHIVIATLVRVMSQKPKINRFIVGKKAYARNHISISLAVKRSMDEEAEETTIKVTFDPKSTIYDVVKKINEEVENNKVENSNNNTDRFAKLIAFFPNFLISFAIGFIKFLDNRGWLPRFILELSPFHCSAFVTDVGSLGIKPIYHHIYNLGTTTVFLAFGTRTKEQIFEEGDVTHKKAMDIKVVADERVVDGFYYANALKMAKRLIERPEELKTPPSEVVIDDGI